MGIQRWQMAVVVLLAASGAGAQENLAPNPGFEGADGAAPAFWEKRTGDDDARRLEWSDQIARSGKRSLQVTNRRAEWSRWRTGHLCDLVARPGAPFAFSAWVKTEKVVGRAYLTLYFMAADGKMLTQLSSAPLEGDRDWTPLRVTATAPAQPSYAMLYLEVDGTGTAWFDDVALAGERGAERLLGPVEPVRFGPEEFWTLDGYQTALREGRPVLQIPPKMPEARATLYFTEESARYDIAIEYLDEPDGASALHLSLNGRDLGTRRFDATRDGIRDVPATWVLKDVDVQRNSRLVLHGRPDEGECCRVVAVLCRRVGAFQGDLLPPGALRPPPSLLVYTGASERAAGRAMLGTFVHSRGVAPATARREAELAALKSPEEWRVYQGRIRARLADCFGPFPEKTPLKPRLVGTIERDRYAIEKVIFESRPASFVTANFYRPKGRTFPVPGVLFVCGHSGDGKGAQLYHECCLGLVLKGYAVLAIDPTGQGERSEYFDPATLKPLVPLTVAQHHQLGRPAFLVGQTLVGYRTWDALRGVDYLVSRPEVDGRRIAAVGNSGGGQMALLVTAVDERVAVCAAGHPGGSMENTYLNGQGLRDHEVLSLIAPRPCRFIVGRDSGEGYHAQRVEDLRRFCRGLGADEQRCEMKWVDGVHNLQQPKRVAAYEWLNRWFGKDEEGSEEPALEPLKPAELWCTPHGSALKALRGKSGAQLNADRLAEIAPRRTLPKTPADATAQADALRLAVKKRLGLDLPAEREAPPVRRAGTVECDGFTAELLALTPEEGIQVPALLLRPAKARPGAPVILHASDRGKPVRVEGSMAGERRPYPLPIELCRRGYPVLSVDVRGVGETDPRAGKFAASAAGYEEANFPRDSVAINAYGYLGRALDGMRACDLVRAADAVRTLDECRGRPVVAVGEGQAGLWALLAGALEPRIAAVAAVRTLLSYRMLVEIPYHEVRGYFWTPEVLRDFDIPDLAALLSPRRTLWLAPTDALGRPVSKKSGAAALRWSTALHRQAGGGAEWSAAADARALQQALGRWSDGVME